MQPQHSLVNFPYSVDSTRFVPSRRATSQDVIVLGTASRLVSLKGLDVALRALANVAQSGETNICYRIAGAGPEEAPLRTVLEPWPGKSR